MKKLDMYIRLVIMTTAILGMFCAIRIIEVPNQGLGDAIAYIILGSCIVMCFSTAKNAWVSVPGTVLGLLILAQGAYELFVKTGGPNLLSKIL